MLRHINNSFRGRGGCWKKRHGQENNQQAFGYCSCVFLSRPPQKKHRNENDAMHYGIRGQRKRVLSLCPKTRMFVLCLILLPSHTRPRLGELLACWFWLPQQVGQMYSRWVKEEEEVSLLHTDSSVDSSMGLMYSKPSNSDWSILLMTSSSSGVSCTGSLVNWVSKFSRP